MRALQIVKARVALEDNNSLGQIPDTFDVNFHGIDYTFATHDGNDAYIRTYKCSSRYVSMDLVLSRCGEDKAVRGVLTLASHHFAKDYHMSIKRFSLAKLQDEIEVAMEKDHIR